MDVNAINPILTAFTTILPQIGFQQIESEILSKEKTKEGKELIRQFLIHAIK